MPSDRLPREQDSLKQTTRCYILYSHVLARTASLESPLTHNFLYTKMNCQIYQITQDKISREVHKNFPASNKFILKYVILLVRNTYTSTSHLFALKKGIYVISESYFTLRCDLVEVSFLRGYIWHIHTKQVPGVE